MTQGRTWLRRLSTAALVAAAALFITRTVLANSRDLSEFQWQVRPGLLSLSVVVHVAVLAWGVFVWSRVLRHFSGAQTRLGSLLEIWALSNAARYIPGVVWQFFAAARLGTASGMSTTLTLTSMLVHIVFTLAAAALVAATTLPLGVLFDLSASAVWLARALIAACVLIAIHPAVINRGLRLAHGALKREVLAWNATFADGLTLVFLAVLNWGLSGAAFFLFITSLAPLPYSALSAAAGVNALAFMAGYLVIPAPGGLGVRESAMTLLLAPLLPVGVAAVVAVAARLWSIAAELGLIALALFLRRPAVPDESPAPVR